MFYLKKFRTFRFPFRRSLFQSGKWCKGKASFFNYQIFSQKKLKKFSLPILRTFSRCFVGGVSLKAGAKMKHYFLICKYFNNFF